MQARNPEYYFAVIKERSITKAAEKLYVFKPYLSQYITKLEKDTGMKLFNRSVTPFIPTEAGYMLFEYLEINCRKRMNDRIMHVLYQSLS